MKKVPKNSEGRFVRVEYKDVGARDGIIVAIDDDRLDFRFFELGARDTVRVQADMILKIGKYIGAENTGL